MNLQQLLVMGRATKDAEILKTKEGNDYARFYIAVSEYLGRDRLEKITHYTMLIFNKTADKAAAIKKGDLVMVDGKPDVDAYISNDGEAKATILVIVDKWKILK